MDKIRINVLSKADSVPAQGVGSAFVEQVRLIKQSNLLDVEINSKKKDFDLIHIHSVNLPYFFKMKRYKGRNIVYVHFIPSRNDGSIRLPKLIGWIFNKYVNAFYKRASNLVVVNPCFIDPLLELGIAKEKITYVPNYVDSSEFFKKSDKEVLDMRKKYEISPDEFVVLGVGQIQTRKGIDDFIETAKLNPDMKFIWAGGFSFGRITHGYKKYKKIMQNPPKNVKFLGILDRKSMNDIYNISNCLFMPSYCELFPMAILEASRIGVPILLRDLDLYSPILFDYYLKGKDPKSFSEELQKLEKDKDVFASYSSKSSNISKYYNKDNILKIWETYYKQKANI